jgi:hypothetical protein
VLKATGRLQRAGPKCFDVLGQCAWTASESRAGAGALAGDGVLQLRREGDAQKGGRGGLTGTARRKEWCADRHLSAWMTGPEAMWREERRMSSARSSGFGVGMLASCSSEDGGSIALCLCCQQEDGPK